MKISFRAWRALRSAVSTARWLPILGTFALASPAFAASITLSGSASAGSPLSCGFTTDTFSLIYSGQTLSDSASASRSCDVINNNPPPTFLVSTPTATLSATVTPVSNGNISLAWSGAVNSLPNTTEASGSVRLDIIDVLTIIGGGAYDITLHVNGSGTTTGTCDGYSFTANLFVDGALQLAGVLQPPNPLMITPCSTTSDRTFTINAVDGQVLSLRTIFDGRLGPNSTASFDGTHTGFVSIVPQTAGSSFRAESELTYATPTAVPEPTTIVLMGTALIGAGLHRVRRGWRSAPGSRFPSSFGT